MIKKILQIFLFSFIVKDFTELSYAQNLVPNPGFEVYDTCPDFSGQIHFAPPWTNPTYESPDFLNSCGINGYTWPNSYAGYVTPHTGIGIAFIATYANINNTNISLREYIQVELTNMLLPSTEYCIKFYTWLADSAQFASYNIGAYFSTVEIMSTTNYNLPYAPQVNNTASNPLSNKGVWKEVVGSFVASGGEKYLIIGNFNDNANTTAVFVGGGTSIGWEIAGYYIDNVSVVTGDCLTGYHNREKNNNILKIYPNPTVGKIYINGQENIYSVKVFTSNSEEIKINYNPYKHLLDMTHLSAGLYFIQVQTAIEIITQKVFLIK